MRWLRRLPELFEPQIRCGIDINESKATLCLAKCVSGQWTVVKQFTGDHGSAQAWAKKNGVSDSGLHGIISQIPFRIDVIEGVNSEEELSPEALENETTIPGTKAEDFEHLLIQWRHQSLSVQYRKDLMEHWVEQLVSFGSFWKLQWAPLMVLHWAAWTGIKEPGVYIHLEEKQYHLLFFDLNGLLAYSRISTNLSQDSDEMSHILSLGAELSKALLYFWEAHLSQEKMKSIYLLEPDERIKQAIQHSGIDISIVTMPAKAKFSMVPRPLLGTIAALDIGPDETLDCSLSNPGLGTLQRNLLWRQRCARLTQTLSIACLSVTLLLCLLVISGLGMQLLLKYSQNRSAEQLQRALKVRQTMGSLQNDLERFRPIVEKRSTIAKELQNGSESAPEGLWLEKWSLESSEKGAEQVMQGYAFETQQIQNFLKSLETEGNYSQVILKSTETVAGPWVQEKTGLAANRKDLIHFQIVVNP